MIIEIQKEGNLHCLYSDDVDLYELGALVKVRRATNIEFNDQIWEVINCASGQVVFRDKNREKCIKWEIENFQPGGKYYRR